MNFREIAQILPRTPPTDRGTFEQERREVLDSIFETLCRRPADPDEMAACAFLVRHLNSLPASG